MHTEGVLRRAVPTVLVLALSLAPLWPTPSQADGTDPEALSVLFIGNSFTRFHQLDRLVRKLAENDPGAPRIHTLVETRPGCTLRRHFIRRHAVQRIRAGGFTHVVLQDHSLRPLDHPDEMAVYARRFEEEIERSGATTVLYATWARSPGSRFYRRRPELDPRSMQARIDTVYGALAQNLGAELAPVGDAFSEAASVLPDDVPLRGRDGIHPTLAGSYLAACVLYRTLTGRSPEGSSYVPWGLSPEVARALRHVAAPLDETPPGP